MRHERLDDEGLETARRVITTVLHEHLDDIVFDKILVKPYVSEFDEDDDQEYLRIRAIYEGERKRLRPDRTSELPLLLRESLWDAGVTAFPITYLIMKSEWDQDPDLE